MKKQESQWKNMIAGYSDEVWVLTDAYAWSAEIQVASPEPPVPNEVIYKKYVSRQKISQTKQNIPLLQLNISR